MTEEESIFENGVSDCASNFLKGLSEGERNLLKSPMNNSRETIANILSEYEKTDGAFIDEISELDYQILRRVSSPTLFVADMIKNGTLKIPAKWGDENEVARTILSLSAESESSTLRKEQIILRDERSKTSPYALDRAQKINRLGSFTANLRQPKSPPLGERPGQMQV